MNHSQGGASAFPTQKIEENLLLLGFPALTARGYPLGSFPNSGSRVLPPEALKSRSRLSEVWKFPG